MQLLLGLFLFSVLLTTGYSLECEVCAAGGKDCSGSKEKCPGNNAACITLRAEITSGVLTTIKSCSTKELCKNYEQQKGKIPTDIGGSIQGIPVGAAIKEVVCSKAASTFASLFPTFFGLLLMKLLF